MKKILMTAVLLSLAGCATGFSKPGATYEQYLADRFDCLKVASGAYCVNGGLFDSCMGQKGWSADSNGFTPPKGSRVRACN